MHAITRRIKLAEPPCGKSERKAKELLKYYIISLKLEEQCPFEYIQSIYMYIER